MDSTRADDRSASPLAVTAVLLTVGASVLVGAGCADIAQARALAHAKESPEAVARAVLDAVEREDESNLRRLLVSREEHRELLWPLLPERKTLPFDYVRELNMHNTTEGIDEALRTYGGSELEFVRIEFRREPERYESFTIHRGARVWVRRASDGETGYIETLDVLVEWNGRWKPMNYAE